MVCQVSTIHAGPFLPACENDFGVEGGVIHDSEVCKMFDKITFINVTGRPLLDNHS
jgi:hypothetical protein